MTDTLDENQKEVQKVKTFKEKILEDLKHAHEQKESALSSAKAREEELRIALLEAEKEARHREEELRLAEEAKQEEDFLKEALKEAEEKEARLRQEAIELQKNEELERQAKEEAERLAQAQKVREEAYRKAAEKEKRDRILKELANQDSGTDDGLTITERAKQRMLLAESLLDDTLTSVVEAPQDNRNLAEPEVTEDQSQEDDELVIDIDSLENPTAPIFLTAEHLDLASEVKKTKTASKRNRSTNAIASKIAGILVGFIVILTLVTAFIGYRYVTNALLPVNKNATNYIQVEIPEGSGNKLIGQILAESGVIKSGTVFNYYTKFKNHTNFKSGYYNLQQNMSVEEIIKILQDGGTAEPVSPALGKIRIPEGYTIKQIAKAITNNVKTKETGDKTPFSSKEFLDLVQDDAFIAKMVEKYPTLLGNLPDKSVAIYQLEGYLFPATYDYFDDTTLEDLVDQMLAATNTTLSPYYNTIAEQNMTVNEVLTLASLVEKEGSTDNDRQMIASVFTNRLSQNMPLQSNIAVLYAMGKLGEKTTLAEDAGIDTTIDSPYNVYKNTGLMPGPVDSPSLSAIKAVISPSDTDYLYFVADVTTGKVYYASDYETHQENVEKYVNSKL